MKEADLYPPLKKYLQKQGYDVKAEIERCDLVALRGEEPPLVVELKLSLNLTVLLQAVDRLALSDTVYIGVPSQCTALKKKRHKILKLFRLLGLGLIVINPSLKVPTVQTLLDPKDYRPRQSKPRKNRLLKEFTQRVGDPNLGGSSTRKGLVTAYRQRAITIAKHLEKHGASKAADIAKACQDPDARKLLYRDVYGWFDRPSRGVYALSPRGKKALPTWLTTN